MKDGKIIAQQMSISGWKFILKDIREKLLATYKIYALNNKWRICKYGTE